MTPPPSSESPPLPFPAARAPLAPVVPERRGVVSILSNVGRRGEWVVPRLFRTLALLGNVDLDLTRARLGPGVSELEIVCVLGSVTIIVPAGVRLECEGEPMLGSFEVSGARTAAAAADAADAPVVRIRGSAFLGAVDVKVVDPTVDGRPVWLRRSMGSVRGDGHGEGASRGGA